MLIYTSTKKRVSKTQVQTTKKLKFNQEVNLNVEKV